MLSAFFSKIIILGTVTIFSTGSCAQISIETTDPSASLVPAITAVVRSVKQALHDEGIAFQAEEEKSSSEIIFRGKLSAPGCAPSPKPSAAEYLAHDQDSLATAKNTLARFSKKAEKLKACLKTKAARTILDVIMREACINVKDIEFTLNEWSTELPEEYPHNAVDYALHDRFQKASSQALFLLIDHITPGILAGSTDERADLKALCSYFRAIAYELDDWYEDSAFYSVLRQHFIECYDKVPTSDFIARATILQQINNAGGSALQTMYDSDDYAIQSSVLELTRTYFEAMKLWFVDKAKPDMRTYVFNTPWRLHRFSKHAPELFEFCQANSRAAIEADFIKNKWKNWTQANQTIWVDPKGCISIRLKTDGSKKFTVGFLAENPYYLYKKVLCLDTYILGDRRTEMLKFSPYQSLPFIIPAALNEDTPYWNQAGLLSRKIMGSSHGTTK